VDANGRLHRWLFHHALALARFNPPGLIFRSASRFYQRIEAYRAVLESVSAPFLPLIEWQPTALGNVEVLNDTSDLYRYFDATAHAEFLYACVEQVIESTCQPRSTSSKRSTRSANGFSRSLTCRPTRWSSCALSSPKMGGRLSKRARTEEFAALSTEEVEAVEQAFALTFGAGATA
jgi:hypothetical protein